MKSAFSNHQEVRQGKDRANRRLRLLALTALSAGAFCSWLLADQTVPPTTVSSGQAIQITDPGKITTSGTTTVQSGGKAAFVGGSSVTLLPGFSANNGSIFIVSVDMNLGGFASLADTDFDGLPDAWEMLHFGNLNATGAQDSDGDGVSNLDEYRAGTDPMLIETTAVMPGGSLVVLKTPSGQFKRVTTAWDIANAP